VQDGYLTSTRGRGVFVSETKAADDEMSLEADGLLDEFIERCRDLGMSAWGIRKLLSKRLSLLDAERDEASGLTRRSKEDDHLRDHLRRQRRA
jgi:hypothetical protein